MADLASTGHPPTPPAPPGGSRSATAPLRTPTTGVVGHGGSRPGMPGSFGQAVAVVGMASVFPGAGDVATFWRNIVGGVDAISVVPPGRWDVDVFYHPADLGPPAADLGPRAARAKDDDRATSGPGAGPVAGRVYCRRGGFVDEFATFDPTAFGIMPVAVDVAEPDQLLALRLAAEAFDDAGGLDAGGGGAGGRSRTGVVLGRGGYPSAGYGRLEQRVKTAAQLATTLREVLPGLAESDVERVRAAFAAKLGPERPEATIGLVPNLAASRIANRLDLHGPAYTIDAACASSLVAVDLAVRDLVAGRADMMVAGGSHLVHEITFWSVFSQLRALSPSERIRPFDRRADGLLIGEGVGMVVLQRLDDALRDGRRVYAVIRGCGTASDGRSSSLMAPASAGQELAVRRAWADAGLDPAEPGALGLVEAHGTATPAGDAAELATLARVFGPRSGAGAPPIGVGSVKSMIGHTMPAAGIAGLIKAALALHNRTLPPTLHCDEPHPAFEDSRFAPVREAAGWERVDGQPRRAGVNAFGFGGINAHVVLEEAPGADRGAPPSSVFGGRATGRAIRVPAAHPGDAGRRAAGAAALAADPAAMPTAEPVLMLAGAGPADIAAALDAPDAELLARDDAARPPQGGPCRLALVAPTPRRLALARSVARRGKPWRGRNDLWFSPSGLLGTGSLAFLFCGLEDKFHPRVGDVAEHFGLPRPPAADTSELGLHGVASVEVGRLLDAALRRLGIVPDHVGGHSVGEWNAMISSGLVDPAYADAFIDAFDPSALEVPGVVFGALGCGVDAARDAIGGLADVVVSHDNCPHQSIICGQQASVTTALGRLRAGGVLGQLLPFRSGFHSPFLEPYLDLSRAATRAVPLSRAQVPVWSATTVMPYPTDPDEVRDLVIRHLVEPVRFRELTRRLYAEGVRVFVQVGVGSVAGFVEDTLSGDDHVAVVSNTPKRSGLDQLRRVAAAVWAEGGAPRTDLLPSASEVASGSADRQPAEELQARPARAGRDPAGAVPGTSTVRLALGAPLVRLGPGAPTLSAALPTQPTRALPTAAETAASRSGTPVPDALRTRLAGHPVLDELDAAVGEATGALAEVVARWADTAPARSGLENARSLRPAAGDQSAPSRSGLESARSLRPAAGDQSALSAAVGVPAERPTAAGRPVVSRVPAAPRVLTGGGVGGPVPAIPAPDGAGVAGAGAGGAVRTTVRRMSLATMPFIIDHCFFRQPPGWHDIVDRFPLVPMTGMIEIMIEEARALAGGGVPVAVRDLRALRWLAVEPPVDVTIKAAVVADGPATPGRVGPNSAAGPNGAGRGGAGRGGAGPNGTAKFNTVAVRVSLDGYARGTVVLAGDYPTAPARTDVTADLVDRAGGPARLPGEEPAPDQPDDVYRTWMFHGPGYQGMERIDAVAAVGIRGQLVVRSAPGALLDSVGQLFGCWATRHLDTDWSLLPQSISEIRFFGPPPVENSRLGCVVRIREVEEKAVRADMELRRADGQVWAHVTGWTDRRFATDQVLWTLTSSPERAGVAQPTEDGWVMASERWRDSASRDLVLRHYLDAGGRDELASRNPRAAREWALGRVAVQDAVRHWLWKAGAGPVWAIEVGIGHTPAGRPIVTALPRRPDVARLRVPQVSVAHKPELAVAIADAAGDVGIDVEKVVLAGEGTERLALSGAELRLLDELGGHGTGARALWFTRFWSAKEAAAKADGTGLQGRPTGFVVDRLLPAPIDTPGRPGPPLLVRISVAAAPDAARGDSHGEGDSPSAHARWVALRTINLSGAVLRGTNEVGGAEGAAYVVAWTSPEVETQARDREGAQHV